MKRNLIFVWAICCAIYLALAPWRHPYFNMPVFCVLVLIGVSFAIFIERKRLGEWKGVFFAAVVVHLASVVAYLVTWLAESTTGIQKVLSHSDFATVFGQMFLFPFFSYAAPVVFLVTACNKMLVRRSASLTK